MVDKKPEQKDNDLPVFFGKVDRHPEKGHIWTDLPSYLMETHLDNMKEELFQMKNRLKLGLVPNDSLSLVKEQIAKVQGRVNDIEGARPTVTQAQETRMKKGMAEFGQQYSDALFTHDEVTLGFADPHEIAKRMKDMRIPVRDVGLAKALNIPMTKDGKTHRDGIAKGLKILKAWFGESTNLERYRKGSLTHKTRGRIHNISIDDMIKQRV